MRTHYVAIDNSQQIEVMESTDRAPECGSGATPAVRLWGHIPRIGHTGFGREFLKVVGYLLRLGVDEAVINLEPHEAESHLCLRVSQADGRLQASFDLFVLLYKQ